LFPVLEEKKGVCEPPKMRCKTVSPCAFLGRVPSFLQLLRGVWEAQTGSYGSSMCCGRTEFELQKEI
jgi:hypothetical protein